MDACRRRRDGNCVAIKIPSTKLLTFTGTLCHCESRRQADEAIFSGNGIIILPLLEKIASSVTACGAATRNDTKCYIGIQLSPWYCHDGGFTAVKNAFTLHD